MKRNDFVWCDDCGEHVATPHNSKDCADKWKRECIIARNGLSHLRNTQRTQLAGMIAAGNPCRDATYLGAWAAETVQQADALLAELTKEEK